MMKTKPTAKLNVRSGDEIEMNCSACDLPQMHEVRSTTKQGVVTETICIVCETIVKFTRGNKTSVNIGSAKTAAAYDRHRTYRKGQTMTHDKFGRGEVLAAEAHKMDVLFGDEKRRLVHGLSE